jgi:hypothetical protein
LCCFYYLTNCIFVHCFKYAYAYFICIAYLYHVILKMSCKYQVLHIDVQIVSN